MSKTKLTPKEQKFAELCVELGNQTEAYRQAYDVTDKDADWIKVKASQIASKDNIRITIEELRKGLRNDNKISQQKIIDYHMEIVDWYRELKELARQKNLSKEDKARVYMLKDLIKGSDYRGSLDSITKMLGLNAPEKHEHEVKKITIEEKKRET
jgi:hypothetical protein